MRSRLPQGVRWQYLVLLALTLVPTGWLTTGPLGRSAVAAASAPITCAAALAPATPSTPSASPPTALPATPAAFPPNGGDLTIFAAASLTEAFIAIQTELATSAPGVRITYNFAGSQQLVTQIAQGAHADLFAAADAQQMANARQQGLIAGVPVVFAHNQLAIAVPRDNPAGINGPADLAKPGVKLVLAQAAVPVGHYARQAICAMGADPATYGAGFIDRVAANIVSEEDNVKAVVAKVRLGEADAGIVYTTDVAANTGSDLTVIPIPAAVNVRADYPIAPVTDGNAPLAAAFIAELLGPGGQATLARYGFGTVATP